MCGRYSLSENKAELQAQFQFEMLEELNPRYNIAPSQNILAVGSNGQRRKGSFLQWGLVPFWADNPKIGYKMINARSESIDEKPSFKHAFKKRRCLILADGFYEWKKENGHKQPYRFVMKDQKPFAFAGLYEVWKKSDHPLVTCTIITTTPNEVTEEIHDRMPVILPADTYDLWLDPKNEDVTMLKSLLTPYPAEQMIKYPVSTLINSPKNDQIDCLDEKNSL
ncbi:SOS response-associated peptidase [Cytobacillus spongiae]|uniref:SOS response-associated peptidase n=1 Tax=Cytobacillus spongiae TaxID=2901381 RepID=UPI001F2C1403|nr:SOS response-associated peptidase [Cytobacillus spongiae]UII57563.1 SOS response-associated peptidase [Cytobacillus spongiae]